MKELKRCAFCILISEILALRVAEEVGKQHVVVVVGLYRRIQITSHVKTWCCYGNGIGAASRDASLCVYYGGGVGSVIVVCLRNAHNVPLSVFIFHSRDCRATLLRCKRFHSQRNENEQIGRRRKRSRRKCIVIGVLKIRSN